MVPGVPVTLQGKKGRPRGRTTVVHNFDEILGKDWTAFEQPTPGWKGTSKSRRIRDANRDWNRRYGPGDPEEYRRVILPKLASIPLRHLQATTRLSKTTCSQIRRGLKVPHPRHWEALRRITVR